MSVNTGTKKIILGSTKAVTLRGKQPIEISFKIDAKKLAEARASFKRQRVFLTLEDYASENHPSYYVYLGSPFKDDPEKHPELLLGPINTYGLPEATEAGGDGMYQSFEITNKKWNEKTMHISFIPWMQSGDAVTLRIKSVRLVVMDS
jgi:hypothetical protein